MNDERLSSLWSMSTESQVLREIDFEDLIESLWMPSAGRKESLSFYCIMSVFVAVKVNLFTV